MITAETLVGMPAFMDEPQSTQCDMMLWALSADHPNGVEIIELCAKFSELGLFRPNSTRVKSAFKQSRNVRTVSRGLYAPTREWAQVMEARFSTATLHLSEAFDANEIQLPPYVSEDRRADLVRMIGIYAQLFLLENSMRGLIEKVLQRHFGHDWWEAAANTQMKRKEAERQEKERIKKWAPARSEFGPLFALDWSDLITLMRKYEPLFKPYLGEIDFLHRYDDAAMFRHVVAHNGALRDEDDLALIAIDYRAWIKQLSGAVANAA